MGMRKIGAVPVSAVTGMDLWRLTREWAELPAGTEVSPLRRGYNGQTNRTEQTVSVQSGPRKGETVTGEVQ